LKISVSNIIEEVELILKSLEGHHNKAKSEYIFERDDFIKVRNKGFRSSILMHIFYRLRTISSYIEDKNI